MVPHLPNKVNGAGKMSQRIENNIVQMVFRESGRGWTCEGGSGPQFLQTLEEFEDSSLWCGKRGAKWGAAQRDQEITINGEVYFIPDFLCDEHAKAYHKVES